ncbi:hypothetical protein [Terriglobus sp.]|uniref:hypothetical protein n=1 Tax=Terriglobus sp. TaxID=1889013 RepID=UPI003B00962E
MPDHTMFLALPNDLYTEALELARLRRITLSDLLIEALSESVESQQHSGWIAERVPLTIDRVLRYR